MSVHRVPRSVITSHAPQAARGAFLFNEEHRVVFAGGIVQGGDQILLLIGYPFVRAAVLVDHNARQGAPSSPLAVSALLFGLWRLAFKLSAFSPLIRPCLDLVCGSLKRPSLRKSFYSACQK